MGGTAVAVGRRTMIAVASLAFCVLILSGASLAYAYDEPKAAIEHHVVAYDYGCDPCHRPGPGYTTTCTLCHPEHHYETTVPDPAAGKGPHGFYDSTTDRCSACHTVHAAGGGKLLARSTVSESCLLCHDGTGGRGVYGAVFARTGSEPGGAHRIDTATIVPGGDPLEGGDATMPFKGAGATLTCGDCHSPHDSNTVNAYKIERWRCSYSNRSGMVPGLTYRGVTSTHLLRRNPGDATATVADYGSDWCLACHAGRVSGGSVHNHPVGSLSTETSPSTVATLPVLDSDSETAVTVMGTLAGTNRGYLMPYPRTPEQSGHRPICQQCHEDSRNVGLLTGTGATADALPSLITTPDGKNEGDNPRFQNFPHESENATMLVEPDDDLCTNCHPTAQLP
jgi:predicted CXXCH cytochrome family protein